MAASTPVARALVDVARATGYRPVEAEALYQLADLQVDSEQLEDAARSAEQAVWAAEASRADELAARAWILLLQTRSRWCRA